MDLEAEKERQQTKLDVALRQLWLAYYELHNLVGTKGLSDLDTEIWARVVRHPAIQRALEQE